MEVIATLPPPHLSRMWEIAKNTNINLFRYNTGTNTPYIPKHTIENILKIVPKKNYV